MASLFSDEGADPPFPPGADGPSPPAPGAAAAALGPRVGVVMPGSTDGETTALGRATGRPGSRGGLPPLPTRVAGADGSSNRGGGATSPGAHAGTLGSAPVPDAGSPRLSVRDTPPAIEGVEAVAKTDESATIGATGRVAQPTRESRGVSGDWGRGPPDGSKRGHQPRHVQACPPCTTGGDVQQNRLALAGGRGRDVGASRSERPHASTLVH